MAGSHEVTGSNPVFSTIIFLSFLPYSTSANANILLRKYSSIALSVKKCELPCLTGVTGCDRWLFIYQLNFLSYLKP